MSTLPPSASNVALEQLAFLGEAVAACGALDAAQRLGLLARLEVGPVDPATLARDCRIAERGARLLLATLASLGLAQLVEDGAYRATAPHLARLGGLIGVWHQLEEVVRTDRPIVAGDTPAGAESFYPDVVPVLGAMFAPAAERAADHLAAAGLRVLDIGAGAAPWSLALARRDPACHVTAVDLPAVVPSLQRAIAAAGRDAQYRCLGGDVFELHLEPVAYDLAIIGSFCHLFDEGANRRLLGRVFPALRSGGTLAILDVVPNEQLDGPRSVILYALGLLLRTTEGRVYPFSSYAGWLRGAGYEAIERIDLSSLPPVSLITARHP